MRPQDAAMAREEPYVQGGVARKNRGAVPAARRGTANEFQRQRRRPPFRNIRRVHIREGENGSLQYRAPAVAGGTPNDRRGAANAVAANGARAAIKSEFTVSSNVTLQLDSAGLRGRRKLVLGAKDAARREASAPLPTV